MAIRDDALKRIADALERKFDVEPRVDATGAIVSNLNRIIEALAAGMGINRNNLVSPTGIQSIAEMFESEFSVAPEIKANNVEDPLDRLAHAVETGYNVQPIDAMAMVRIAHVFETRFSFTPLLDSHGRIHDGLTRIADVVESSNFVNDPIQEFEFAMANQPYTSGTTLDTSNASATVTRMSGKVETIGAEDLTINPDDNYTMPHAGYQFVTASYDEETK